MARSTVRSWCSLPTAEHRAFFHQRQLALGFSDRALGAKVGKSRGLAYWLRSTPGARIEPETALLLAAALQVPLDRLFAVHVQPAPLARQGAA